MSLFELLAASSGVVAVLMVLLWLASLALRDVSIVDVFWGLGFVVIAWLSFVLTEESSARKVLLLVMTSIWGLRLTAHLARRKYGEPEDSRYQAMRKSIGPRFPFLSLFVVFGPQGLVMLIVALPLMAGPFEASPLGLLAFLGAALWCAGLLFEAVGDYQLARFKTDPANRGKVLDQGLWRYTRHPNYFGDFLVWWGIYLVAAGPSAWWTVIGPLLMSFLLLRISGVALLERSLRQSKEGYAAYQAKTSAFFPWPPRSDA